MRIFKTKWVARFAEKERIPDDGLSEAVERAARGLVDADLGGGIIKQRVARPGRGHSGGYRMLIAYRERDRAVFLYGFAKSERESISQDELETLREIGADWLKADDTRIAEAIEERFCRRCSMATKTEPSRLAQALLETADDMRRAGIMDAATHEKITLRHLGDQAGVVVEPISGDEIRALREHANLSQAVFARCLHLTVGYVSQLERGIKHPSGPALVLLDVIRRKGIQAIL